MTAEVQDRPKRRAPAPVRDLQREMEAAKIIRAQLETLGAEDEDLARDMIEGETDLLEMVAAIVAHDGEDEAILDGIARYKSEIDARKKRIEGRMEVRRALLASALEISGRQNFETPTGTVSSAKIAPKAIVTEEADIPTRFWKAAAPVLDKKALADALKGGEQIPGATLSNGGTTVKIRRG